MSDRDENTSANTTCYLLSPRVHFNSSLSDHNLVMIIRRFTYKVRNLGLTRSRNVVTGTKTYLPVTSNILIM